MVGCTSPDNGGNSPLPSQIALPSQEPVQTPTISSAPDEACQFSGDDLSTWAATLPYEEVALFPQTYLDNFTLNLWFMNPSLTQASLDEISTWAAESAISALKQLTLQGECVLEFDNVFVTVVDPQYQVWFTGNLRPGDVAQIAVDEENDLSGEIGGGQITPTDENSLTGGGQACLWADRTHSLTGHFSTSAQYTSFMLTRDAGGTTLSAYLVLPQAPTDEFAAQLIADIYGLAGCLQTQLDGISIILTMPNNQLSLTGYQPLAPGSGYNPADFTFTRFETP